MRKTKTYACDGGSLLIGTAKSRSAFVNCYGDGEHSVTVTDTPMGRTPDNWQFRGAVEGNEIKVFNYDCLSDWECDDEDNILFTLSGRYGVFAVEHSGDMVLVKWN